ncbi:MAG: hypothetical protein Faunusvirus7_29 [Faunusvirus sp.]|jgi:hypothetical protein|uniref:DM2 domain-containing protein n=1 Tax=Faunusvirus sp. TaxID=2487766 RepID=A0A3G4ZZ48_9VIRU|nr:MAG: hypothetical protein Faunusvirus7_29 [Faunusvirus sp.]
MNLTSLAGVNEMKVKLNKLSKLKKASKIKLIKKYVMEEQEKRSKFVKQPPVIKSVVEDSDSATSDSESDGDTNLSKDVVDQIIDELRMGNVFRNVLKYIKKNSLLENKVMIKIDPVLKRLFNTDDTVMSVNMNDIKKYIA